MLLPSALGAALAVLCGLLLWRTSPGEPWVNASYDYLFRFGRHATTNRVSLILMDSAAFNQFHQTRGQPWDRALHAQLLNRLADDGCKLVVFDSFFRAPRDPVSDAQLAAAMRRQRGVVLMAEQSPVLHPDLAGAQPILPDDFFLNASGTNWGVAWLDPDLDGVVRRHWPFPSPGIYPSLPEAVARRAGAKFSDVPQERWLRYYGREETWTQLSYGFALTQPKGVFRDQIVFIGTQPKTSVPQDGETDEFRTPYTRWTGESAGGTEILVAATLNLLEGDWLRRPPAWLEGLVFVVAGAGLGGGLCRLRFGAACAGATAASLVLMLGTAACCHTTNYWFPWVIIAGGQLPCALAWAAVVPRFFARKVSAAEVAPEIPDYELIQPPIGEGAYGKVWLARNKEGRWVALKVIFLASFAENPAPYEREFNGIKKYQLVSDQHPDLLRVFFVSERLEAGYFYYAMELGDARQPGWENDPPSYRPRDLLNERLQLPHRRLPVRECVRIGLHLTDALEFLHRQGLTHRDIKPQNIIFVNGRPKLADMGLITDIRLFDNERTLVGTPGFMPPPPERPGTPQADVYALGMVLYVLATGRSAAFFPEIATTLVVSSEPADFFPLNNIILKACQPEAVDRYTSAAEMRAALAVAQAALAAK
jgi:CHASE2 domain-containing sensor protein